MTALAIPLISETLRSGATLTSGTLIRAYARNHTIQQKYGKQLTLVGAIQAGQKLDSQYFEVDEIVQHLGANATYGNGSATGRAGQSLKRQKAIESRAEATKKKKSKVGCSIVALVQITGSFSSFSSL